MNLNKIIQTNAFINNDPFSTTFPDSFTGAGLKDIYLPDFVGQRITVIVSINGIEANNIGNKISGTLAAGSLRYLNALIMPNISVTENSEIVYNINNDSFVNNYNVDDPTDSGIIKSGDLDITIEAREDAPELNYMITGVFNTIGTTGNMTLNINEPFSIIPINNSEIFLNFRSPIVGDVLSALKFNNYTNTINLFSVSESKLNPIFNKVQFKTNLKIQANSRTGSDYFGKAVCKTDKYVIVGAPNADAGGTDSGKVFIYDLEKDLELELNASDGEAYDSFGFAISYDELTNTLVVGAYIEDDTASNSGSVYLYNLSNFEYDAVSSSEIKIQSSDIEASDYFGWKLSCSNGILAVSSKLNDELSTDAGAVYLYKLDSFNKTDIINSELKLQASNTGYGDYFGYSISLDNNILAVGSYSEDTNVSAAGATYIYDISSYDRDTIASTEIFLQEPIPEGSEHFGYDVCINDSKLVVGAAYKDTVGGADAGAAFVYDLSVFDTDSISSSVITLYASDAQTLDYFGSAVSVFGNNVLIGAYGEDTAGISAGQCYLYDLTSNSEILIQDSEIKISSDDLYGGDNFGYDLTIYNNTLVIGAHNEDTSASNAGAVYIYDVDTIKANLD